ncbi:acyltransferase family protein [Aureitalea marina]|uniref:acyltransferase family protein n=1 Tax=Aureitalea marina TaxID=930804 RepID=UPI0011B09AC4|nr:acyltransferase family protein [Aureitalea marina]
MKPSIELIRLVAVFMITFTHTRHQLEEGWLYFLVEILPTYGTAILSVISGYLYFTVSRKKKYLFQKKVKSLAIPYLIANVSVVMLVLFSYYVLGFNPLNRLGIGPELFTEGVLALNMEPVNPPTYFIRDIFLVFAVIALLTQKEWRALPVILVFLVFGSLFLRLDVVGLFIIGTLYGMVRDRLNRGWFVALSALAVAVVAMWFPQYLKWPIAVFLFILVIDLEFKFYNTGRYAYLLHLYHSPIIVITYPFIGAHISNPFLSIGSQILTASLLVYFMLLFTRRFPVLTILSGGR